MLNLDTHILLFALSDQLTTAEQRLLSRDTWSISAIVLWEIAKLSQLKRIEADLDDPEIYRVLTRIHTWPITTEVCRALGSLDFKGDPADELIAATSVAHRVPLMTRDRQIKKSKIVPFA